jgi:hypothetical protein
MYINKNVKKLMKDIPREYHQTILEIVKASYQQGAGDVLEIVKEFGEKVNPINPTDYMIAHESEIDGG